MIVKKTKLKLIALIGPCLHSVAKNACPRHGASQGMRIDAGHRATSARLVARWAQAPGRRASAAASELRLEAIRNSGAPAASRSSSARVKRVWAAWKSPVPK